MIHNFWDISAANLVTWAILIVGFVTSQYIAVKLLGQRMDGFEKWRSEHIKESDTRAAVLVRMDKQIVELSTLSRLAQKRFDMIDRRKTPGE